MKHLKILFPVLLCTLLLGLSSCKETNADRLRAMRGDWESVKNRPAFTLFEENGHYDPQNDLPGDYPNGNLSDFRTGRKPVHRNGAFRPADLRQGERPDFTFTRRGIQTE